MALIKCPECGKEFSDKANACPNCACPNTALIDAPVHNGKLVYKPGFLQPIYGMKIDKKNRTFCCSILSGIHSFDDIIDVDIYENGSSMTKSNTASVIGRSVAGSLVNPVGAIIGGVTAKKKTVEIIDSMEVQITIKDERNPLLKIKIPIPKHTKKDSKEYKKAIEKARTTVAAIKNLQLL